MSEYLGPEDRDPVRPSAYNAALEHMASKNSERRAGSVTLFIADALGVTLGIGAILAGGYVILRATQPTCENSLATPAAATTTVGPDRINPTLPAQSNPAPAQRRTPAC